MNRTKIESLTANSKAIREELGLTKEEIFWMQVDMGSEFLRVYYPDCSLYVATKTNFWDIWVFEWMKDDVLILNEFELDSICKNGYRILKDGMNDDRVLEQLNALLEWK